MTWIFLQIVLNLLVLFSIHQFANQKTKRQFYRVVHLKITKMKCFLHFITYFFSYFSNWMPLYLNNGPFLSYCHHHSFTKISSSKMYANLGTIKCIQWFISIAFQNLLIWISFRFEKSEYKTLNGLSSLITGFPLCTYFFVDVPMYVLCFWLTLTLSSRMTLYLLNFEVR